MAFSSSFSSPEDEEFFKKTPWCARLLADPNFVLRPTDSRQVKQSEEDAFFAETLATPRTIPRCLTLCRLPSEPSSALLPEMRMMVTLGSGLNGWPGIAHGGIAASLMDEAMGVLLGLNKTRRKELGLTTAWANTFTAYLNIVYKKPVPTSAIVLLTAEVVNVSGRKTLLKSTIEDGAGVVFSSAEALFVEAKPNL